MTSAYGVSRNCDISAITHGISDSFMNWRMLTHQGLKENKIFCISVITGLNQEDKGLRACTQFRTQITHRLIHRLPVAMPVENALSCIPDEKKPYM